MSRGRALRVMLHLTRANLQAPPPGVSDFHVHSFLCRKREALLEQIERLLPAFIPCSACETLASGVYLAVLRERFETTPIDMDLPLPWDTGDLCRVELDAPHYSVVHSSHELGRVPLCDLRTQHRFTLVRGRRPLVALLACSATKADAPAPARELYQGQLFRFAKAWAERHADAWGVLSGRHGLVLPDEILEPYDERIPGAQDARLLWAKRVQAEIQRKWSRAHLVVLASAPYRAALETSAYGPPLSWEAPLAGLEIGQQLQALKRAIEGVAPLRLRGPA